MKPIQVQTEHTNLDEAFPVRIYIHVAVMGHVNEVLHHQLLLIKESKLYHYCEAIYLLVSGDFSLLKIDLEDPAQKFHIEHTGYEIDTYEFPTLHRIWIDSQESEFAVLYLHTKGVSKPKELSVRHWVHYLLYFLVEKWSERLLDLQTHDCSGVNLRGSSSNPVDTPEDWFVKGSPLHYSGNFWWSRSSYIRRLPDPVVFQTVHTEMLRYYCEMWLLQLKGKFHCAWYSGVLHHKEEPYPEFLYRSESIYRFFRYLLEKPFRLYIQVLRIIASKKQVVS